MGRLLLFLAITTLGAVVSDGAPQADRTPAEAVSTPPPDYPPDALRDGVEGTVLIEFQIDEEGRVARAWVTRSVPGLDQAAIETVRKWRFEPARRGDTPIATLARAPVEFRITEKTLPDPPPDFDLEKTIRYGEGPGEIPVVRVDRDVCSSVSLSGSALRVARLARKVKAGDVEVDSAAVHRQAAGTLTVYFRRGVVVRAKTTHYAGGVVRRGAENTCPKAFPTGVSVRGAKGDELEPLGRTRVVPRKTRDSRGKSWTTYHAVGVFDWEKALALSDGGRRLTAVVEFTQGKPMTFEFDEEALRDLTPDWANGELGTPDS